MSFKYDATLPTGVPLWTTSRIWRTEWFVPSRHSHNHLDYKRCHNRLNQISFLELQLLQLACDEIPPHFGRSPAILERKNCFHRRYHPWVSQFLGIQKVNHVPPPGELLVEAILETRVVWFLKTWHMQEFRLRNLYFSIHPTRPD